MSSILMSELLRLRLAGRSGYARWSDLPHTSYLVRITLITPLVSSSAVRCAHRPLIALPSTAGFKAITRPHKIKITYPVLSTRSRGLPPFISASASLIIVFTSYSHSGQYEYHPTPRPIRLRKGSPALRLSTPPPRLPPPSSRPNVPHRTGMHDKP